MRRAVSLLFYAVAGTEVAWNSNAAACCCSAAIAVSASHEEANPRPERWRVIGLQQRSRR
jgi:hypothetical protein